MHAFTKQVSAMPSHSAGWQISILQNKYKLCYQPVLSILQPKKKTLIKRKPGLFKSNREYWQH
jgi:hypothetical protein